jgi:hypothetical protein
MRTRAYRRARLWISPVCFAQKVYPYSIDEGRLSDKASIGAASSQSNGNECLNFKRHLMRLCGLLFPRKLAFMATLQQPGAGSCGVG